MLGRNSTVWEEQEPPFLHLTVPQQVPAPRTPPISGILMDEGSVEAELACKGVTLQ